MESSPMVPDRRGVMELLLRRRDPGGDAPFDPEDDPPVSDGGGETADP